jgi:hypothetical protein
MVALRGIRWRPGRSVVVLLLAAVAVAASVTIPLYTAAAQRSVLADALAPERTGSVPVAAVGAGSWEREPSIVQVQAAVDRVVQTSPTLKQLLVPSAAYVDDVARPLGVRPSVGEIVFREDVCAHLTPVAGRCADQLDELMISERAAADLKVRVGDRMGLKAGRPQLPVPGVAIETEPRPDPTYQIVGVYRPVDPDEPFWGTSAYFDVGGFQINPDSLTITLDAMFVGRPAGVIQIPFSRPQAHSDYRLRYDRIQLDDANELRSELEALIGVAATERVSVETVLPSSLADAERSQRAIAASVPVVALPLVALCWFVLFLVVAALTEERGGEIALGKLRGLGPGALTRFGVAEPLLLVVAAAPLGVALGIGTTAGANWAFLAPGGRISVGLAVVVATLAAMAGAVLAAVLGARRTLGASVMALMRRVPPRAKRATTVVEAAVGVLAAAALVQVLVAGDRSSPMAYAAAPLIALLAGLLTARLLGGWARRRMAAAGNRGRLAELLASAMVGRRRGGVRLVAAVTAAVAILTFAATVWDVAVVNQERVARAAVGAAQVFTVTASDVRALQRAVDHADPSGQGAMAVVRTQQYFRDGYVQLIGVDSSRMAAVTKWPDRSAAQLARLARDLSVDAAPPIQLRGARVQVTATVEGLRQAPAQPMSLGIVVARPGRPAETLPLGRLVPGRRVYDRKADCADGCRLIGIAVQRFIGDFTPGAVRVRISQVADAGRPVDAGLGDPDTWRVAAELPPGQTLALTPRAGELEMGVTSESASDIVAEYGDTPVAAPAVVAGPSPTDDPGADRFAMPALGDKPEPFRIVEREALLPRVGDHGVLFDLATLMSSAERGTGLRSDLAFEVWADDSVGPDFARRLGEAGVVVRSVDTHQRRLTELDRAAPALALRLYLLAGAVALLLALGAVLLDAYTGARWRRREISGLWVAGVLPSILRGALLREYRLLLGAPLLVGTAAGLGGAALILPAIPLAGTGDLAVAPEYRLAAWWLVGALVLLVAAFVAVVAIVMRMVRPTEVR